MINILIRRVLKRESEIIMRLETGNL